MRTVKKLSSAALLFIFLINPPELLSQDKNLSIRLSVTKNCISERRMMISHQSFKSSDSGEDNRSFNCGIIFKLVSNKFFELEIEKFSCFEQEYTSMGKIDDDSYETNRTSMEVKPLTFSFMHRFYKVEDLSFFYRAGLSWYPVRIKDTITSYQSTDAAGIQNYYEGYRKNTFGFGLTYGASFKVEELFSVIVSAELRIIDDIRMDKLIHPLTRSFEGLFLKAGILFDIF
ncbi:hypothetical protein ACFL6O_01385 [candidate division KSB1 bacterium]